MKTITIIGGGEAGIHLIRRLRHYRPEVPIVLVEKRTHYFQRKQLFGWWAGLGSCEVVKLEDLAKELGFTFIHDKVERINHKTRKIYFKEAEALSFQRLVLATGICSNDLSIKGDFREGFCYLSELDPFRGRDLLRFSKDVFIYATTFLGIKLALNLAFAGKDVKLAVNDFLFLKEEEVRVQELLGKLHIEILKNAHIQEIIGEGRIKAVKVDLPKVFAADMVFVDSGFTYRSFPTEDLQIPAESFFTAHEDIFVAGGLLDHYLEQEKFFVRTTQEVYRGADMLAHYLLNGQQLPYCAHAVAEQERKEMVDTIISLFQSKIVAQASNRHNETVSSG